MQQASADKLFLMAQELSHQLAITPHEWLAITPHPPSPELLDAALKQLALLGAITSKAGQSLSKAPYLTAIAPYHQSTISDGKNLHCHCHWMYTVKNDALNSHGTCVETTQPAFTLLREKDMCGFHTPLSV